MTWYASAILSVVGISLGIVCTKKLQEDYDVEVYLFYVWLLSSFFLYIISFPVEFQIITPYVLLVVFFAGMMSWLGNYAYNISMKLQPNIGYVESLSGIRVAFAYVIAVVFFDGKIELTKIFAIVILMTSVFLVANEPQKTKEVFDVKWVIWAGISGLFFAALAVSTKIVFLRGAEPATVTCLFFFVASIMFLTTSIQKRSLRFPSKKIGILLLAGLLTSIGNFALFYSYKIAPNLAYPIAISNSRIILLFIFSLIRKQENLNATRTVGVILAFVSIMLLS